MVDLRSTDKQTDRQTSRLLQRQKFLFDLQDNESTFGLDNPGFDDSYSIREKPSKSGSPKLNQDENVIFPKSDDMGILQSIKLIQQTIGKKTTVAQQQLFFHRLNIEKNIYLIKVLIKILYQ